MHDPASDLARCAAKDSECQIPIKSTVHAGVRRSEKAGLVAPLVEEGVPAHSLVQISFFAVVLPIHQRHHCMGAQTPTL